MIGDLVFLIIMVMFLGTIVYGIWRAGRYFDRRDISARTVAIHEIERRREENQLHMLEAEIRAAELQLPRKAGTRQ